MIASQVSQALETSVHSSGKISDLLAELKVLQARLLPDIDSPTYSVFMPCTIVETDSSQWPWATKSLFRLPLLSE